MADIRKRTGTNGTTYQVRYASGATKSGYAYKTFSSRKEAKAFLESGKAREVGDLLKRQLSVSEAVDLWLRVCEKEGLNGAEPVTPYTLQNYRYRAGYITSYPWAADLNQLTAPDIVEFRSWLLSGRVSRSLASKVLSTLHSVMREMTVRGYVKHNVAAGVTIRTDSRYDEPVTIPTPADIRELLSAADRLANSKNATVANAWVRYRPLLYLAVDSGMGPQEYLAVSRDAFDDYGVHVNRAIDGSGNRLSVTKTAAGRRYIDLSAQTLDMVQHYMAHHTKDNDFDLVFPANNGRWMCRRNWQRRGFNVACIEAGLVADESIDDRSGPTVKYRPYDLRHFYASMLIDNKVNLKRIQSLMGHSNIETTLNVYGHLLESEEEQERSPVGIISHNLKKSCGKSLASAL